MRNVLLVSLLLTFFMGCSNGIPDLPKRKCTVDGTVYRSYCDLLDNPMVGGFDVAVTSGEKYELATFVGLPPTELRWKHQSKVENIHEVMRYNGMSLVHVKSWRVGANGRYSRFDLSWMKTAKLKKLARKKVKNGTQVDKVKKNHLISASRQNRKAAGGSHESKVELDGHIAVYKRCKIQKEATLELVDQGNEFVVVKVKQRLNFNNECPPGTLILIRIEDWSKSR